MEDRAGNVAGRPSSVARSGQRARKGGDRIVSGESEDEEIRIAERSASTRLGVVGWDRSG